MKSRATWLEFGDDNTKFFQAYARGRKDANTVWILLDDRGMIHYTFNGMARTWVEHFENMFKSPPHESIAKVIRIAQLFPRFVEEEDNLALMEEVIEG